MYAGSNGGNSKVARTTAFVVRVFSLGISSRSLAWHLRARASGYDFFGHQAGEAEFHEGHQRPPIRELEADGSTIHSQKTRTTKSGGPRYACYACLPFVCGRRGFSSCGRPPVQSVRGPLRHLVAYGSTNKYRPVTSCKISGSSAKRPTQTVYFFCATATMLTMTATVKTMDSQRWVCRTHLFQFNGTSSEGEPEAGRFSLDCQEIFLF